MQGVNIGTGIGTGIEEVQAEILGMDAAQMYVICSQGQAASSWDRCRYRYRYWYSIDVCHMWPEAAGSSWEEPVPALFSLCPLSSSPPATLYFISAQFDTEKYSWLIKDAHCSAEQKSSVTVQYSDGLIMDAHNLGTSRLPAPQANSTSHFILHYNPPLSCSQS